MKVKLRGGDEAIDSYAMAKSMQNFEYDSEDTKSQIESKLEVIKEIEKNINRWQKVNKDNTREKIACGIATKGRTWFYGEGRLYP